MQEEDSTPPSSPKAPTKSSIEEAIRSETAPAIQEVLRKIRYGACNVQGLRKTQEDSHTCSTNLETNTRGADAQENDRYAFFGVYDGHGGKLASEYVAKNLNLYLVQEKTDGNDVPAALREALKRIETDWLAQAKQNNLSDGTTAAVAVIDKNGLMVVANIGDSEIVLCRRGKALPLCEVHNPKRNASEHARIEAEGGRIWHSRVAHPNLNPCFFSIAVSRSIGDLLFKDNKYLEGKISGLSAEPDLRALQLCDQDEFCVIACDGLWDVMSHEVTVQFVRAHLERSDDPQRVSQMLVHEALKLGSTDNITAVVITFKHWPAPASASIPTEPPTSVLNAESSSSSESSHSSASSSSSVSSSSSFHQPVPADCTATTSAVTTNANESSSHDSSSSSSASSAAQQQSGEGGSV